MLHVYEFEIYDDPDGSGMMVVEPFDMDGATSGEDFKDACEMAADWLMTEMEHRAIRELPFPEATFDNTPNNGGRVVTVAVSTKPLTAA